MDAIIHSHKTQINNIAKEVRLFYQLGKKVRIYHGSTNSTRTQVFKKGEMVDISGLNHILKIDKKNLYAIVEPNVAMDQLVEATLQYGLLPPVVMEFPGITVGGGIQGGAGESSSFKWGLFHNTTLSYEVITGNGKMITVSPTQNADFYWGTPGSYGSLGILTAIKVKLIQAKKYVRLTYKRTESFQEACQYIEKQTHTNTDFIDGILFSKKKGVIMTGVLSNEENFPTATFAKATDDWFYVHAQKVMEKHTRWTELIPLKDYLFRYDRGAFWVGKYAFFKAGIPFNRFTRFILNPLLKTRVLYRFLHAINISQRQFIQDLILPNDKVLKFLKYIDKYIRIYPLWLCPGWVKKGKDKLSPGHLKKGYGIDVGVWGKVFMEFPEFIKLNQRVEKVISKMGGRKVLYAHQYYSENDFWKIYDKNWYNKLRKKYHGDRVFPDIYQKTHVKEQYRYSYKKGLLNVIKSPFKLPVT